MAINSAVLAVLAAITTFFIVILIFALLFCLCQKPISTSDHRQIQSRAATHRMPELSSTIVDESTIFDPSLRISMADLVIATKNFSSDLIIGDGSFGLVYKAQLSSGVTVAIKKLDPDAFQGFREFLAEMETLAKLRHPNLVKILGYCMSGADRLLIYEFIERGSLDQCLYDTSSSAVEVSEPKKSLMQLPLPWDTRIKIVKGVANGLSFLHGLFKPIIHRDIKASNVLLDSEFEAHIADFGLARTIDTSYSHVSTQVAGTMGYMPPEYKNGITSATVKADVYSFGILMLEIAMGRRPHLLLVLDGREMVLAEWAGKMVVQNRQMEMVDSSISREGLVESNVKEYFRIACMCTNEKAKARPPMNEVAGLLTRIIDSKSDNFNV